MGQEDENQSKKVSLNDARAYIRWWNKKTKQEYNLPTLEELKLGMESNSIVMAGKEWTKEGWVYDPILDKVDKHPKSAVTAGFRLVLVVDKRQ